MKGSLEDVLQQIEKEANDDLALLAELNPRFFPTQDLVHLKYKLEKAKLTYNKQFKKLVLLGCAIPFFLMISLIFGFLELKTLAIIFLLLGPLTFIGFVIFAFTMNQKYGSNGRFEFLIRKVDEELLNRNYSKRKQY